MACSRHDTREPTEADRAALREAGFSPVTQWQRGGVVMSTTTALKTAGALQKIDLPALRAALATLEEHDALLDESEADLWETKGQPGDIVLRLNPIERVKRALRHVIEDDFRSHETRGGS